MSIIHKRFSDVSRTFSALQMNYKAFKVIL